MARPRKDRARGKRTTHPGIYERWGKRGAYWQIRIRFNDPATGVTLELENRAEYFDPNDQDDRLAALERAKAWVAAERANMLEHGKPIIQTDEAQLLRHWLERYRVEVIEPHEQGLIPLPGQKPTAADMAKIPAYSRNVKYRKGWETERNQIERWLGIGVVEKAKFLSKARRDQVVAQQAFFRSFFARRVLDLKPADFYGRPDSLVEQARNQTGGPATDPTKLRWLAVISAVYKRARSSWGFEAVPDPIKALEHKPSPGQRRERPITLEEWAQVWEGLKDAHISTRAFIAFCRWTAARRGEPENLRWEDISGWGTGSVVARLRNTKTTKPGEYNQRPIPLQPEAVAAVAMTLANPATPPPSGWVFPSPADANKPLPGGTAWQAWDRARVRVGLPPNEKGEIPTLHDLRHTRASELVSLGLELPKMMAITGHKDTRTALRYYHARPHEVGAEILALETKKKQKSTKKKGETPSSNALAQLIENNPRLERRLLAMAEILAAEDDDAAS